MSTLKNRFEVGQKVMCRRMSDKAIRFAGEVVKIHDGADDCLDVKMIPDGKLVEVERVETVHAADVQPLETPAPKSENGSNDGDKEKEKSATQEQGQQASSQQQSSVQPAASESETK